MANNTNTEPIDQKIPYVWALMPMLLTALFYLPALDNSFVWDDKTLIVQNPQLRSLDLDSIRWMFTTTLGGNWMPLTWLSFALDAMMGGGNPRSFHFTNILLHVLNTGLVFLLARRLFIFPQRNNALSMALFTGILFGLHPIHVESVAWVTERKDVLYSFFFLLAILQYMAYATGKDRSRKQWLACLGLFSLSLMSKPMAVTLPLVLIILDYWPLERSHNEGGKIWIEKIPFFILSLGIGIITVIGQGKTRAFSMAGELSLPLRIVNAGRSLMFYIGKLFVPIDLSPLYPFPNTQGTLVQIQSTLAVVAVVSLFALCWIYRKKWPALITAWLLYFIMLAPVLGIVQVGAQSSADRYMYLPSLVIFIGASYMFLRMTPSRAWLQVILGTGLALLLGMMTVQQSRVWKTPASVWERVIAIYPDRSSFAHANLGSHYMTAGRFEDALREYERAVAIPPVSADAYSGKGAALLELGREAEATDAFQKALAVDPKDLQAHQNLWAIYGRRGMLQEALEQIQMAVQLDPSNAEDMGKLAINQLMLGKVEEAEASFRQCISLNPTGVDAYVNLGSIHMKKGSFSQAVEMFEKARILRPADEKISDLLDQAKKKTH